MPKFTIYSKINCRPLSTFEHIRNLVSKGKPFDFDTVALELFHLQARHNPVYNDFLKHLGIQSKRITHISQIPFMPVEFFKKHKVLSAGIDAQVIYSSSGTTGQLVSKHYVPDQRFYLNHAQRIFENEYGPLTDYHILALLPGYLEREGSSLIDMVQFFITEADDEWSGFFLHDHDGLRERISMLNKKGKRKILLLGVSFALLDLAEKGNFPITEGLIVMETGGMKGRRRELLREELHELLIKAFSVEKIHSEYGMTEALSQAYSRGDGIFHPPFSMQLKLRDPNDPLDLTDSVERGAVNLVDLANVYSCAFLQLKDLGERAGKGTFRILGRMDNSDVRGCNLMVL